MRLSSVFTVAMAAICFTPSIVLSEDSMETCTLCENGSTYAQQKQIPSDTENSTCQMLDFLALFVGGDFCDNVRQHASWCECPGAEPGCPFCDVGFEPVSSDMTLVGTNMTCGMMNYLAHIADPNSTSCTVFEAFVDVCGGCTPVVPPPPMEADPCDKVCPDGSDVPFPNNNIFGEDEFTCGQLEIILPFVNPFDSCPLAHYIGVSECGCPDTLPPVPEDAECYVCQDESAPTKPSFEILPDLTCRGLGYALLIENETCSAIQATAGSYCGCDNNTTMNACRICGGDNLLPEPSRIAESSGMMDDVPCLDLEFQANVGNISCMEVQNTWAPVCCPTPSPSMMPSVQPSGAPSSSPSSSPSTKPSMMPSMIPSLFPSDFPSMIPSFMPSIIPSFVPTVIPTKTMAPTESVAPSMSPTSAAWKISMNLFMVSFTTGVALLFLVY